MILVLTVAGLLAGVPLGVKRWRAERHRLLLARQLRQAVTGMVQALRAGVSFPVALQYAAREGAEPLASVWKGCAAELAVGRPLSDVLGELPRRVPLRDIQGFVTAALITQQTGGSLAGVLETLSESLQEKETLREKIAALTAQGKASGVLISLLPFLVMGSLWGLAPEMASPMFKTQEGQMALAGILVSLAAGALVMSRIVRVPVEAETIPARLPEALDLMALVMRAGLDFGTALAEYLKRTPHGPLWDAWAGLQAQWNAGVPRLEALRRMREGATDSSLRDTLQAIIQAQELGSSLAPVLARQAAALRRQRALQAEKVAAVIPLKLMFPLFVFIFPTLFVALLGPVWLKIRSGGVG